MNKSLDDPLLSRARRDAVLVGFLWCASAAYTIGYCWWFGYHRGLDELRFVWGFPEWVFWGVVVPWGVCIAIGCWFAFFFMKDEDLDADEEPPLAAADEKETIHG